MHHPLYAGFVDKCRTRLKRENAHTRVSSMGIWAVVQLFEEYHLQLTPFLSTSNQHCWQRCKSRLIQVIKSALDWSSKQALFIETSLLNTAMLKLWWFPGLNRCGTSCGVHMRYCNGERVTPTSLSITEQLANFHQTEIDVQTEKPDIPGDYSWHVMPFIGATCWSKIVTCRIS